MTSHPKLLDQFGRPVRRGELREEIAAPTFGGVRSPLGGYPSQGLDPMRLANILRAADEGDPVRYLELAEEIEEKDPHYLGVLGTRKRSISQVPISVKPGGDSQFDLDLAKEVEAWLDRDELRGELFDILDCIGKGYSHTEIIWDTSMGQWQPARLEWRDPRWFRFDRIDHRTPVMLDQHGAERPYPGFKFIYANMKAKSGLPVRSGLARVATWSFLFKAFTQRDWAIFTQTYGQPIRVGKYGPGASERDRDTLFNAVANIGGDCAAIIPESMMIEFIESSNVGSSTDHYERRSDWLDKQISKAVLGQTATTDAETGGLGSGKEHRQVQEDIETADCGDLQAILNRDLVRPFCELNYGALQRYPRIVIERPEEEDLKAFADAVTPFVDRGLRIATSEVYDKFGLSAPAKGAEILMPTPQSGPEPGLETLPAAANSSETAVKYLFNTLLGTSGGSTPESLQSRSAGHSGDPSEMVDRLAADAGAPMADILEKIEAMLSGASSLEEFREMLLTGFADLDASELTDVLALAFTAAHGAGRVALEEESG